MADNRFRWTQIQPADSGEAVTALTSAGNLFEKAIGQAQKGLDKYKAADQRLLAEAQAKNLARIQDTVAGAKTLGQYGQLAPTMERDVLRQKYTDAQGNVLVDIGAATDAFAAQREAAVGRTMEDISKRAQTDLDKQQATNLQAMQRAAAELPPELQGAVTFDAAGNPIVDPRMGAEFGQQFAEKAQEYGFLDLDAYQQRRQNVRELEDAKYMTRDEIQQAEQRMQDVLVAQEQIDDRYKGAVATATEQANTEYDSQLETLDKIYQDRINVYGLTIDAMTTIEGGTQFEDWLIDPETGIDRWEGFGGDTADILKVFADAEAADPNVEFTDAQKIWLTKRSLEGQVWSEDKEANIVKLRELIADKGFIKAQTEALSRATDEHRAYADKRKTLQDVRNATIAKANAEALKASGVRQTGANARMLERLKTEGKKAAQASIETAQMPPLTAEQRAAAKIFQPNQTSTAEVSALENAEIDQDKEMQERMMDPNNAFTKLGDAVIDKVQSWDLGEMFKDVRAAITRPEAAAKIVNKTQDLMANNPTEFTAFIKRNPQGAYNLISRTVDTLARQARNTKDATARNKAFEDLLTYTSNVTSVANKMDPDTAQMFNFLAEAVLTQQLNTSN